MEEIRQIKIANLKPCSIGNVRKALGDIKELTASVKAEGILQPITVRAIPKMKDGKPTGEMSNDFEIVFGHRRLAAAKAAKLDTVPSIVVEANDAHVIALQLIENINREDIHPLDEAIGFHRLREEYKYTVEQVMKATGKSKAYVYAALKLVELSPYAMDQFREGKFESSVALYIARLWDDDYQAMACKEIAKGNFMGELMSAREAFKVVDELKKKLELDEKWAKKKERILKKGEKILGQAAAKKVFSGNHVLHDSDYLDLDCTDYEHPEQLKYRQIIAKAMPAIIHAQSPDGRGIFELVSKKDFAAAVKTIYGTKGYKPSGPSLSPEVRKANEKAVAFKKFRAQALPLVTEKAITGPSVNFLRALLLLAIDTVGFGLFNRTLLKAYDRKETTFRASIETMSEKELKDELLVLMITESSTDQFANVCKLLKVSDSHIRKIKQQISDEAKAKAQAAKEREKKRIAKEKAAAKKPVGKTTGKPLVKKKPTKKS